MELNLLMVPLIFVGVTIVALYVMALVDAARHEKWVWFVLMLLLGFVALFYLLFAYEGKRGHRIR